MSRKSRSHSDDLRGAGRLVVEATVGVSQVVQAMQIAISGGPAILGSPLAEPARLFTWPVHASIRAITSLVGGGLDVALERLAPLLGESAPGPARDLALGVLNGVIGDHLARTNNPLAIEMCLRRRGLPIVVSREGLKEELPAATRKLALLVHGSSSSDRLWASGDVDFGDFLARDFGYTTLYLNYNSGLHVSLNGRALADLLERVVDAWPVPLERITLVGHSMGGLVARSALHYGSSAEHRWRSLRLDLVSLATPHHGAPLERGGSWLDLLLETTGYSAPIGRLGRIRSAGVTDLRYGNVVDEDWQGRERFGPGPDDRSFVPLPSDVTCYAVAATSAPGPAKRLPSDGLVPVDSALGRHARPDRTLQFPRENQSIVYATRHNDLLRHPEAYAAIRDWLTRAD